MMFKLGAVFCLSVLSIAPSYGHATKKKVDCQAKVAGWNLTNEQKVKLLEDYQGYEGEKVVELTDVKSMDPQKALKNCTKCEPYLKNIIKYFTEETPRPPGFDFVYNTVDRLGRDEKLLGVVFVNKKKEPIGAYIYLIRKFGEDGDKKNQHMNWVNGYFDEKGKFLGRGEGYAPELDWSFH